MENRYTFSFDEKVDYALDCEDLLYEYLQKHLDLFLDECEYQVLQQRLATKTLGLSDIRIALRCIDQKIG